MIIDVSHDAAITGAENMRRDLALVERVRNLHADVALRFYTWNPWCVSLGAHQKLSSVDAEQCRRRGYDIVMRPTGGRAVLHANEVTYALAARVTANRSARDIYNIIHRKLHGALHGIAPDLECATTAPSLREHYAASGPLGQVCFSAHAPSEIMWRARKVVGSAQRVIDGIVLQHGSILCGMEHEEIGQLIAADTTQRDRIVAAVRTTSASLSDVAQRMILQQEVVQVLREHLTAETLIDLA